MEVGGGGTGVEVGTRVGVGVGDGVGVCGTEGVGVGVGTGMAVAGVAVGGTGVDVGSTSGTPGVGSVGAVVGVALADAVEAIVGVALADAVEAIVGVRIITSTPGPGSRVGTTVGDEAVGNGDAVGIEVATVLSGVEVNSESDPPHETSAMTGMARSNHMRPVMDETPDTEILTGATPLPEHLKWITTSQMHFR